MEYFQQKAKELGELYEEGGGENHKYFIEVKANHFIKILRNYFQDLSQLTCLTIGCGTGETEEHFSKYFKKVVGIDYSEPMIKKAKSKNIANTHFRHMDASQIKFEKSSFDIVVTFNMFHHVHSLDVLKKILKETNRVLKKNGVFINYDMNPLNPITRRIIKTFDIDKDVSLEGFSKNKFPTTFFASEFIYLAEKHDFKKIKKETLIFFPRQLKFLSKFEFLFNKTPFGGVYCLIFKQS